VPRPGPAAGAFQAQATISDEARGERHRYGQRTSPHRRAPHQLPSREHQNRPSLPAAQSLSPAAPPSSHSPPRALRPRPDRLDRSPTPALPSTASLIPLPWTPLPPPRLRPHRPAWTAHQVYLAGRGRGVRCGAADPPCSKAQAGRQGNTRGGAAGCSRLGRTPRDEHLETNNKRRTPSALITSRPDPGKADDYYERPARFLIALSVVAGRMFAPQP
jgi:hypothetical protein